MKEEKFKVESENNSEEKSNSGNKQQDNKSDYKLTSSINGYSSSLFEEVENKINIPNNAEKIEKDLEKINSQSCLTDIEDKKQEISTTENENNNKIQYVHNKQQNKNNNSDLVNSTNSFSELAIKDLPPKNIEIKDKLEDKKFEQIKSLIIININENNNVEEKKIPNTEETKDTKIILNEGKMNDNEKIKISKDKSIIDINNNEFKKEEKLKIFKIEKVKDKNNISINEESKSFDNNEDEHEHELIHPDNEGNNIINSNDEHNHNVSLENRDNELIHSENGGNNGVSGERNIPISSSEEYQSFTDSNQNIILNNPTQTNVVEYVHNINSPSDTEDETQGNFMDLAFNNNNNGLFGNINADNNLENVLYPEEENFNIPNNNNNVNNEDVVHVPNLRHYNANYGRFKR